MRKEPLGLLTSIIELILALICLGTAGHLVIRLFDAHRHSNRSKEQ